jgi:3-phosphoshikimate 1-carboxyvinyltransferase
MRFLVALAGLGSRPTGFRGEGRLPFRPLEERLQVRESRGAIVARPADGLALPLTVGAGPGPTRGGEILIRSGRSSQFASAFLLIGSRLEGGLDLSLTEDAVSLHYVSLTATILSRFGADVEQAGPRRWTVRPSGYGGITWTVEGDWSSASYLLAAAAVAGGSVRVRGLDPASHQPDTALLPVLARGGHRVTSDGVRTDADHRIAMAFAVAGLVLPGMVIPDAQCGGKSNPGFWAQLERLESGS